MKVDSLEFRYLAPKEPDVLIGLSDFGNFVCVVLLSIEVSNRWRDQICLSLVGSGCYYFMAWGRKCEEWHDCLDWTLLEKYNFREIPREKIVMTTEHGTEETLEDVFHFAKYSTSNYGANSPSIQSTNFLILDIGNCGRHEELFQLFQRV